MILATSTVCRTVGARSASSTIKPWWRNRLTVGGCCLTRSIPRKSWWLTVCAMLLWLRSLTSATARTPQTRRNLTRRSPCSKSSTRLYRDILLTRCATKWLAGRLLSVWSTPARQSTHSGKTKIWSMLYQKKVPMCGLTDGWFQRPHKTKKMRRPGLISAAVPTWH